ncbi:DUF423 domain-containing protein [Olleya aquimaris]|uniref:Uncharacterized membrane protein YgdD (TMEM256/DUF423 family) n=1 Tax=Olleya aquimaris TaxID=639310 RepID=A0A327RQ70_9FLAO|nr:DUF423 domain-containing protein [Olleya aquimaris]RAJ18112.1 uncharacterized membrane protein YgdD (TMEM256/DUF423 family) [Olleya aquimaris]
MNKKLLILGSVLGLLSVVLGAFGAHGLKKLISIEAIQSFETGVRYQMYHALLLLFVANQTILQFKTKRMFYYLILFGVILFSGSIYLLATNTLTSFNFKIIGFITPIGGTLLIAGWAILVLNFIKLKQNN